MNDPTASIKIQRPGDIVRITTTINCATDVPAIKVAPLESDDVVRLHSDILTDNEVIFDAIPAEPEVKKLMGSRFDVLDIVKSYGVFANAARTLIKGRSQEFPMRSRRNIVSSCNSKSDVFHKKLKCFLNKEIHIKLEEDANAVTYTLREIEKEFLIVDYGESQRFIPINKILFLQIGIYPKVNAF